MAFPVQEKYILNAETELDVTFPDSFRKRMMLNNGGVVEIDSDYFELYPFYDFSERKRVKRTCNSIVHETVNSRVNYGLSEKLIEIGHNGGGDVLVYRIKSNRNVDSTIYILDHETGELEIVARDFAELDLII